MPSTDKLNLVYQVESDILQHSRLTKLSYRRDARYFGGRAGLIRIINLIVGGISLGFTWIGYYPIQLDPNVESNQQNIRMMKSENFSGYHISKLTLASIALGGSAFVISLIFAIFLYTFMEVRCDLLWERVNQKGHVVACIVSILAAFCDVMSIQDIHEANCKAERCMLDQHATRMTKYEEEFYPPYFIYHYTAFAGYLTNAMLYSIASRIWLRNED